MSSMALDGIARSRSTDPTTSVDAGRSVNVAHSQAYVHVTLALMEKLADHELVTFHEQDTEGHVAWGKFSPQRLRSARAELVEQGVIEFSGIYRLTDSGRRARVWQVAPRPE